MVSSADSQFSTRATTLVVSREPIRPFAVECAARAGRHAVVVTGPPPEWDGHSNGWLPAPAPTELPASAPTELIIEAALLPVVQEHGLDLLRTAQCVHVFANGSSSPFAEPIPRPWGAVKRLLDIVGAAVFLAATAPILAVAMLAIRLESPGPTIFRQARVGKRGHRFTVFKLRTMLEDNDESEHERYVVALMRGQAPRKNGMYKLDDDPRITRVGRLLRRSSIDELPQLWNVLRGDMSLVGPRPPLPREVERYDAVTWARLLGRPGLTGLWQVSGRCELTFGEQVELDLEYWRRWSIWLDLKILARTPIAVLSARGAA